MYSSHVWSEAHHAHQLPGQGSLCLISWKLQIGLKREPFRNFIIMTKTPDQLLKLLYRHLKLLQTYTLIWKQNFPNVIYKWLRAQEYENRNHVNYWYYHFNTSYVKCKSQYFLSCKKNMVKFNSTKGMHKCMEGVNILIFQHHLPHVACRHLKQTYIFLVVKDIFVQRAKQVRTGRPFICYG